MMDRQTLDMEGARQGEISAASLQMGNDTIAIQRIATMTVEANEFAPWDTPNNRSTQKAYATFFVALMFFALLGLAAGWWLSGSGQPSSLVVLSVGGLLFLLAMFCGLRAGVIAAKLRKREKYFRLVIGTSDGRQIPLVDDNRDVLCKIRDVVRHKMDTDDREMTGDFDLNLDIVNLKGVKGETRPSTRPTAQGSALPQPEPPMPRIARGPEDDHQDALFDKVAETMKPVS